MNTIIDHNFNLHSLRIPLQQEGMQVEQRASLSYVDSALPCDTFNVIHIKEGSLLTSEELQEAIMSYRLKNYPYCIWISEQNLTHSVEKIFAQLSLKRTNTEPGMVLDLETYQPQHNLLHEQVVIASTAGQVEDFATVIAANWTPSDENVLTYYKQTATQYLDKANKILLALYYEDGKVVSVIELFATDTDTIGFYGLATLKEYRGQGIGTALMTFSLNQAKALGYKRAILQASQDGIRIYQKLGFRIVTTYFEYA